jgi:23S rRNA pseudouridine2605 synthase
LKRASGKSSAEATQPPADRIQKVLAEAGLGSRREIERWIAEGRISVDGRRASLGDRIAGAEKIVINGRPVRIHGRTGAHRHLAYYKPAGQVTTRDDPEDRPTVFEHLPRLSHGRWISIGRLDMSTSGLLLLTTDGELAHRLMHPRYEISREYAVRLLGAPNEAQLRALTEGVLLDDGPAHFDSIEPRGGSGRNSWIHVTLREGRNREVRRIFEVVGLVVSRLIRVRYGPVQLARMQRGRVRDMTASEVAALYEAVGITLHHPTERASPSNTKRAAKLRPSPQRRSEGKQRPQSSTEIEQKPRRSSDDQRPRRSSDEQRPRRSSNEQRPRRSSDEQRPRRSSDEKRPNNQAKPRARPSSKARPQSGAATGGKAGTRSSGSGNRRRRQP